MRCSSCRSCCPACGLCRRRTCPSTSWWSPTPPLPRHEIASSCPSASSLSCTTCCCAADSCYHISWAVAVHLGTPSSSLKGAHAELQSPSATAGSVPAAAPALRAGRLWHGRPGQRRRRRHRRVCGVGLPPLQGHHLAQDPAGAGHPATGGVPCTGLSNFWISYHLQPCRLLPEVGRLIFNPGLSGSLFLIRLRLYSVLQSSV